MNGEEILAMRVNRVASLHLEIACKICGITPEDTHSGKKHINRVDLSGRTTFIYAEKRIPLVTITYTDDQIKIRRIRKIQYWISRIKGLFGKHYKFVEHGRSN